MPTQVTKLRVFVASPGRLDSFRENFNKTMAEYNRLEALPLDVLFEPVGWEVTIGGHTRAQAAINKELRTCDYAVFMVRDRWGSQSDAAGNYASGFEEEWAIAQEMLDANQMLNIAVCFFPVPENQSNDPGDQFKKVISFRQTLVDGKKEFFKSFKNDQEFEPWLRGYLAAWRRQNEKLDTTSADDTKISRAEAAPPSPPLESGHASATETALMQQLNQLADKEEWAALRAFTITAEALLVEPVNQAFALHLRGYAFGQLNQSTEAIAVYDDLLARFGAATELPLREPVAKALINKGFRLGQLDKSTEAIAVYDDLLARFGAATEPELLNCSNAGTDAIIEDIRHQSGARRRKVILRTCPLARKFNAGGALPPIFT